MKEWLEIELTMSFGGYNAEVRRGENYEYEYDGDGNIKKKNWEQSDTKVGDTRDEEEYDSNGNIVRKMTYYEDGYADGYVYEYVEMQISDLKNYRLQDEGFLFYSYGSMAFMVM